MNNLLSKALRCAALVLPALVAPVAAQASVVITGTRVIYPAGEREVTVQLRNKSTSPALVQTWLDNGIDKDAPPGQIQVPFTIVPPMFRIDPEGQQSLRLVYTGEAVAQDRESLYWLNVLDVPPKAPQQAGEEANQLQIAFRSRLKLFLRPQGLPGTADEAPAKLQWKLQASGEGTVLEVHNPTAYHVSFAQVELVSVAGERHARPDDSAGEQNMVAPGASTRFALPSLASPAAAAQAAAQAEVEFSTIDDLGARQPRKAKLAP